ncbi:MAG: CHAT domain-containing protein [Saprospiraceae bacterium]|nr:CHAT domain-containing protein [Saprospiraceae bacterium]
MTGQPLYTREIYNLQLNADMVVLSACQTGIGRLKRGEGIISLARAFTLAGAQSIVPTLWSVTDGSTKDVMIEFYKAFKMGKAKDDALWFAKKRLSSSKRGKYRRAHPYFWSGIVLIGNTDPIFP